MALSLKSSIAGLPQSRPAAFAAIEAIYYRPRRGAPSWVRADRSATSCELHQVLPVRKPTKYAKRQHYEGHYWFSGVNQLVWHESMEEYSALMWLDHSFEIHGIAAQPMCLYFADGSRHVPDYFARHVGGQQVVYDVRPLARVNEDFMLQAKKTRDLCYQVGWTYVVLTGLDAISRYNLEWIATYRDRRLAADAVLAQAILDHLSRPQRLVDLAQLLDPMVPARHMHHIYGSPDVTVGGFRAP
ncbi:TnsA-like heteromeric transposase endonuclease subunit [Cryobacterium sp. 10S3]|uniref:TnsA-like heteromeric transposase endonuclease subunit n=1 Tax=Cryobacterium sp. 10S3 TaxID=3048582 RepID=UPI002AC9F0C4|nr:TnsA-like heteromeric transposase endonuclease subunit [Cryobacterium sp. 10S3]MEB0288499.1 TnsA-like heteromeric transposase endonuclease subunit [Cryobacterium sp. 10S3]WPX13143.1 TnsA-like heteromeric transposase endonuclease subunit [Cryobacterium sp. 10S3]